MDQYTKELENIIKGKLIPIYNLYYYSMGMIPPALNLPESLKTKKVAALLDSGFSRLPRTAERQEKTKST